MRGVRLGKRGGIREREENNVKRKRGRENRRMFRARSARCSERGRGRQGAVGSRLGAGGGEAYSSVHRLSNR